MPQMKPLFWLLLWSYFLMIYLAFNIIIYYYKFLMINKGLLMNVKKVMGGYNYMW
uniref:ATP synthase F0 subunit 8 n=1 Tax=Pujadella villari TaxID=2943468 RepID=A0A9E8K2K5_9HYME|nr:ATP synthase F0 subunit 8 [Pujadella villari]